MQQDELDKKMEVAITKLSQTHSDVSNIAKKVN